MPVPNGHFDGYPDFHGFPFIRDRLFSVNPKVKLLFFVRNPVKKVISHWTQMQDAHLQIIGKKTFNNPEEMNQRFQQSLDAIHSDKSMRKSTHISCTKMWGFCGRFLNHHTEALNHANVLATVT